MNYPAIDPAMAAFMQQSLNRDLQNTKLHVHQLEHKKRKLDTYLENISQLPKSPLVKGPLIKGSQPSTSLISSYFKPIRTEMEEQSLSIQPQKEDDHKIEEILANKPEEDDDLGLHLEMSSSNRSLKRVRNDNLPTGEDVIKMPIMHITWTEKQKSDAIEKLKEKSIISVYHHFDRRIPYDTLKDWKKLQRTVRKKGSGRKVTSEELDDQLLEWFVDARALKFPITNAILTKKAMEIRDDLVETEENQDLKRKLKDMKFGKNWLKSFKERKRIAARMVNTLCKHTYSSIERNLLSFYNIFDKQKRNCRLFLNMDETPIYMELQHKQTLTIKGENHVGVVSGGREKQRFTVVLTIGYSPYRTHYSVSKVPPIIIFKKAKPKKCTAERPESSIYDDAGVRAIAAEKGALVLQSFSGWNDEYLMTNYYIPHLRNHVPKQISSLLLMDNYPAHNTDAVLETFEANKIQYLPLPPNCTAIIQPIDVGVNALFKRIIKGKFMDWMIKNFDTVVSQRLNSTQKVYQPPTKHQVITWVMEAWEELQDETISKSFITCGLFGEDNDRQKVFARAEEITLKDKKLEQEDPYYIEDAYENGPEEAENEGDPNENGLQSD